MSSSYHASNFAVPRPTWPHLSKVCYDCLLTISERPSQYLLPQVYYFPCGRWLDIKEDDGAIRRRLPVSLRDPRSFKARYRVSVTTSNIRGSGTDANVFIQLFGDEGETGRVNLDNPGK